MITLMSRNPVVAGLILIVGGVIIAVLALQQHDLPEVVLAIGITLLLAWTAERGHRFGASGATLSGLGLGLFIAEHVHGYSDYRDELAFGGIALGLLLAARFMPNGLRGAGSALLSVALFEAALQRLPASISAPSVYRAFDEGWAFGAVIVVYGVVTVLLAQRGGRRRAA